jgi:hypothetical protein
MSPRKTSRAPAPSAARQPKAKKKPVRTRSKALRSAASAVKKGETFPGAWVVRASREGTGAWAANAWPPPKQLFMFWSPLALLLRQQAAMVSMTLDLMQAQQRWLIGPGALTGRSARTSRKRAQPS